MNLFRIAAALTLNSSEYDKGLDESEKKAVKFGKGVGSALKVAGAALTAAVAGVGALTKNAIENYAEYEQLVGGVETLFKGSADKVVAFANDAYKTAGMSANDYMTTVTGFSASLLQSLGGDTDKAADVADRAIRDMSDNANKMGTSMESIQTAYQGFAKQNYTMLDNLKLGYGGTKTEMERLIADAEGLNSAFVATRDENGNLAMSFADIVKAIGIVQDELGITGTTAKEASETISGSVSSMQSAWKNLVTGIADDNADVSDLMTKFVDSVSTAANNILPRINVALAGIGDLVVGLAPVIVNALPTLITDVLPSLISSASQLVGAVNTALIDNLPLLAGAVLTIVESLAASIGNDLPVLIPQIIQAVILVAETLIDHLPELLSAVLLIIEGLGKGILNALPIIIKKLPKIITGIVDFLLGAIPQIIETGIQLLTALVKNLPTIINGIVKAIPLIIKGLIGAILDNLPLIIDAGVKLISALVQNIPLIISTIVRAIPQIISGIISAFRELAPRIASVGITLFGKIREGFVSMLGKVKDWGKDLIDNFVSGIKEKFNKLKEGVESVANTVKKFLGFSEPEEGPLSNFHTYAPDMIDLFVKGIKQNTWRINDALETMSMPELSDGNSFGRSNYGGGVVQNIYATKMTPSQAFVAARNEQERLAWMG